MTNTIGIRREDKHRFERRVPLTPEAVRDLTTRERVRAVVQPSPIRVFDDASYVAAGAELSEDLSSCDAILAVKEVPAQLLLPDVTYVFFSHTIKGQAHNMPLLRRLMELRCTLIDYEPIVDEQGRRLVFFGRHAGLAGMIDTLWTLGRRLAACGIDTPFLGQLLSHEYPSLEDAKRALVELGGRLKETPLPESLAPFVVGFTGYGNVSRGAQEIYDLLGVETVAPDDLERLHRERPQGRLFKVVFEERHLVDAKDPGGVFDLNDYFQHPEKYRSKFERYAPYLSVLINAIYWTDDYPRVLTNEFLRDLYTRETTPHLRVVGDISCDLDGSIQCTVKATTPDRPSYVYDPLRGVVTDGVDGFGVCLMTTDCLPCELPREASESFTQALTPFVPAIAGLDRSVGFEAATMPPEIRGATILWRGELTPDYRYLEEHLRDAE